MAETKSVVTRDNLGNGFSFDADRSKIDVNVKATRVSDVLVQVTNPDGSVVDINTPRGPVRAQNLNSVNYFGYTPIWGVHQSTDLGTTWTVGAPRAQLFNGVRGSQGSVNYVDSGGSATARSKPVTAQSEIASSTNFDWVGYQIASDQSVVQVIYNLSVMAWRENDGGMNSDGTLKNNNWADWYVSGYSG